MIDKSETPCAITKKTSGQPMTVHAKLPSLKKVSILMDITKQYAYLLTHTSGVIRRSRVRHNEIADYEKSDIPIKQVVEYFKHQPLSITAFNELKKIERKINAKYNSN